MKIFGIILGLLALGACGARSVHGSSIDESLDDVHLTDYEWVDSTLCERLKDSSNRSSVLESAIESAQGDSEAISVLISVVRERLMEPMSEMRDTALMRTFVDKVLRLDGLSDSDRSLIKYMLRNLNSCRPGSIMPDIPLVNRSDEALSLLQAVNGGQDLTLIEFYDPDCETCAELQQAVENSQAVKHLLKSGKLQLMGISIYPDAETWRKHPEKARAPWVDTRSKIDMMESDEIILNIIPSLYLVDNEGRVIIKEGTLNSIEDLLETHNN